MAGRGTPGPKASAGCSETREGAFSGLSKQDSTAVADKAEQVRIQAKLADIYARTKSKTSRAPSNR